MSFPHLISENLNYKDFHTFIFFYERMRQNSLEMRFGIGNMRKRLLAAYKGNVIWKNMSKILNPQDFHFLKLSVCHKRRRYVGDFMMVTVLRCWSPTSVTNID